jgi:electron transport complex protein RnfD
MSEHTHSSPFYIKPVSVSGVMLQVVYALIPGIAAYAWLFGWGIIINLCIAVISCLATEAAVLQFRQRPVRASLTDGSALVTGMLLALALPTMAPWWLTVLGAVFAIVFGKQLFGGLGYNPFNPAMLGYAMLLIAFPREMTVWLLPVSLLVEPLSFMDHLGIIFKGEVPAYYNLDAITSATVLDSLKTQLGMGHTMAEARVTPVFGALGGTGWEWINLGFLAGGVWLMFKRVISWHIPLALLGGLALMALIFYIFDPDSYAPPLFHLASGAAILGAFFIATDPVTASTTARGRLIFGAGIGVLTYIIRTWGGYPDGIAFAVLLMNMATPTIDYYTQPRVFGHRRD